MTRQTSIESYHAIKDNGLLSRRRFQVYDFLYNSGPATARQAWRAIAPNGHTGSINTRFAELREIGVVEEVGTTKEQATGMTVILWDVTANLPRRLMKKKSAKAERLRKLELVYRHARDLFSGMLHIKDGGHFPPVDERIHIQASKNDPLVVALQALEPDWDKQ